MDKKSEIKNSLKWEETDYRYVAFIDIMGFKDMVLRNTHDYIYEMMKKIQASTKFSASVEWGGQKDLIKTTTYSDSIMIYSKDNSAESLDSFISTISSLTHDLFVDGIPHKGACAYGKMTLDMDKSIFFGQPLIDAYLLEEEVNFYGVVAHATIEEKIDEHVKNGKTFTFIKTYYCDFKNGKAKHKSIFPFYAHPTYTNEFQTQQYNDLFNAVSNLRYNTSGHLRKYIDSTEKYILDVRNEIEI